MKIRYGLNKRVGSNLIEMLFRKKLPISNMMNWTTRQHLTEYKVYRQYLIHRLDLIDRLINRIEEGPGELMEDSQ